jgi:hypothetical protein
MFHQIEVMFIAAMVVNPKPYNPTTWQVFHKSSLV